MQETGRSTDVRPDVLPGMPGLDLVRPSAAGVRAGVLGWVEDGVFSGKFLGRRRGSGVRVAASQGKGKGHRSGGGYAKTELGQETPARLAAGYRFGRFNTHNKHLLEIARRPEYDEARLRLGKNCAAQAILLGAPDFATGDR